MFENHNFLVVYYLLFEYSNLMENFFMNDNLSKHFNIKGSGDMSDVYKIITTSLKEVMHIFFTSV